MNQPPLGKVLTSRRGFRLFGLSVNDAIRYFFGGNALVSVLVLALITIFLFREGLGFFSQNAYNLRIYRLAGLEWVDNIRAQIEAHTVLTRDLNAMRLAQFLRLTKAGRSIEEANTALAPYDAFAEKFSDAATDVRGLLSDLTDTASAIKQGAQVNEDKREQKAMLLKAGKTEEAATVVIDEVGFATEREALLGTFPTYQEMNVLFGRQLQESLTSAPTLPERGLQARLDGFKKRTADFIGTFSAIEQRMRTWDPAAPIPWHRRVSSFLFGRQWLTASFWQDWYGLMPLLVGSILVSVIALAIAVPFGVSAAIYVSEIAHPREQKIIKPCIEFIAAIPSVVLGFFGIAVLGGSLRRLSEWGGLSWIPGFPMSERLNAVTAGCLLALMAIPTIFSLAEDALTNVPRYFKEASYALGANRLQTIFRVLIPASLSGIISAVLLGFGRVIGETMVVLLCAGNRIAIPDFTEGLAAFFQPVHTMTGIIAQEMGEVPYGSIHYRALLMIGVVLFLIALSINYIAQKIVSRFKVSIG